ncbi:hypothetical protein UCREL1_5884 [Eutypa lata UCREL1]|uniref:Uncharacterized protein n=1 Tax=Eutypa lata (strain UCR-EL1) TaxID=1287681 RepID=M7TB81_EUTLA|nr:hypothetical protein UCREL1_5884 [Eutypa lata UCREL1]
MDRAWTLQEAILNRNHTYVYVEWAPPPSPKDSKGKTYKFTPVGKAPGKYLIDIRILLDMVDANFVPPLPKIVILDGVVTGEGPRARHSLRGALSSKKSVRTAAIWRSMMMRRSSQPVDIIYSAMGCFGLQIDPYRKNHDPEYLFNDLARKAAATKGLGPAWLNIEGVAGSEIARNPASRIVPAFPQTSPDKPPIWTAAGGTKKGAATFITKLADYVSRFDAIFITHSHPHVISAYMLPLTWGRVIASGKANAKLWTMSGTIYYSSKLDRKSWKNVHAIYIGEYNKPTSPRWTRCDVNVDTSKLGQPKFSAVLKYPVPLYLTSCHTNMPPQFVDSYTQWKLTEIGALQMLYSFGGWKKSICAQLAKAGVEGVMIPENKKTPSSITSAPYYVSLRFGRQVIYVQTKPHPKTPRQYTQIYVLPYGGWGGPPLNAPYIIVQQPQQTMTEEEYRNALLRQLGYPNWVVGGNPVVPQLTGSGTISDEA